MNGHPKPHFVLVPLMAQGHIIPMVDLACLLADRGSHVTFITTPVNAARIKPVIDRARSSALPIHFVVLDFPSALAGLPDGCENIDLVTSPDQCLPFFQALSLLHNPVKLYLQDLKLRPTCIISDNCHWWMADIARELDIPRLIFHGPSSFYLLSCHNIRKHRVYANVTDDSERVRVPGLPHDVEITRAQEPGGWFEAPGWEKIREDVLEAEKTADGIVVNTFSELEPEYVERYRKAVGKVVLPVGPLSLYNKDDISKATRGDRACIDQDRILSWLDSKEKDSVLYVCFGSLAQKPRSQLVELGHGLEASKKPFIWVIKEAEKCEEVEEIAGRSKGRGLLITGWAPQVVILSHHAVGGFLTHCGWNSILEGLSAGVPMITWPHFADQFLNARLVVDVLGVGVGVGVEVPCLIFDADGVAVGREEVERVVLRVMVEGEEMRRRAREFGEMAGKAMEEGGSSYENLNFLIKYVMKLAQNS